MVWRSVFRPATKTGSGSQMYGIEQSHIEYLCIAAEIIAALLLISLFIPAKRRSRTLQEDGYVPSLPSNASQSSSPPPPHNSSLTLPSEDFRELVLGYICYRNIARERGWSRSDNVPDTPWPPVALQHAKWEDRITGLGNQAFAEAFLVRWLSIPQPQTQPTWFSLFAFDSYTEFLHQRGAFEFEIQLKRIGKLLSDWLPAGQLAFSIAPDRFLIVQSGLEQSEAIANLKRWNQSIAQSPENADPKIKPSSQRDNSSLETDLPALRLINCTLTAQEVLEHVRPYVPPEELPPPLSPAELLDALEQALQATTECGWNSTLQLSGKVLDIESLDSESIETAPPMAVNDAGEGLGIETAAEEGQTGDDLDEELKIVSELQGISLPQVLAKPAEPSEHEEATGLAQSSESRLDRKQGLDRGSGHATLSAQATQKEIEALMNELQARKAQASERKALEQDR